MKKQIAAALLMLFTATTFAQVAPTDANQFANQSGVIAGVAQACGQNVTVFVSRVMDVINVLGKTASDQQQALTLFEKTMANAQYAQSKNQTMNCAAVIQAFNTLPIMQANYKQAVLPQLTNSSPTTTPSAPPAAQPSTTQQLVTGSNS